MSHEKTNQQPVDHRKEDGELEAIRQQHDTANRQIDGLPSKLSTSQLARQKAKYTRAARHRLSCIQQRKHDIESDIINAAAVGRLANRKLIEQLDMRFDEAYSAASAELIRLRKSSPLDWRLTKLPMEQKLAAAKEAVDALESQFGDGKS